MTDASRASEPAGEQLTLSLSALAHLFTAPAVDPLSSSAAEVLGVSGVDYALSLLYLARRRVPPRTLVVELPEQVVPAAHAERVKMALRRWANARLGQGQRELSNTYRYGWRVAGVAILLLALCLVLTAFFAGELTEGMPPLLRKTFEYGFEIVGWVILWNPVDVLVFAPLPIRYRMRALRALVAMDVVVRAQPRRDVA